MIFTKIRCSPSRQLRVDRHVINNLSSSLILFVKTNQNASLTLKNFYSTKLHVSNLFLCLDSMFIKHGSKRPVGGSKRPGSKRPWIETSGYHVRRERKLKRTSGRKDPPNQEDKKSAKIENTLIACSNRGQRLPTQYKAL